MIHFLYGASQRFIDVTRDVFTKCVRDGRVYIPAGDTGSMLFPDPLPGIAKGILLIESENGTLSGRFFGPNEEIAVALRDSDTIGDQPNEFQARRRGIVPAPAHLATEEKLQFYHSQLEFFGGDLGGFERVEQLNAIDFLDPNAKVLELGSGRGRNSLLISCLLDDESNLVTLECNSDSLEFLRINRSANGFQFHIEPAALSYRKLMYNSGLEVTIPGEVLQQGYEWVDTVTFEAIQEKYGIEFDTLVADCEGALFYILQDNEGLLENIRTVILESDYLLAEHKWAVEDIFCRYGFTKVKYWRLEPQTADLPKECMDSFWEVWKR